MLNSILKILTPQKGHEDTENHSNPKRLYKTWTRNEQNTLDEHIKYAKLKRRKVNITRIRVIMPYRSLSSIRCKVRERCALLNVEYGTYTEDLTKEE